MVTRLSSSWTTSGSPSSPPTACCRGGASPRRGRRGGDSAWVVRIRTRGQPGPLPVGPAAGCVSWTSRPRLWPLRGARALPRGARRDRASADAPPSPRGGPGGRCAAGRSELAGLSDGPAQLVAGVSAGREAVEATLKVRLHPARAHAESAQLALGERRPGEAAQNPNWRPKHSSKSAFTSELDSSYWASIEVTR